MALNWTVSTDDQNQIISIAHRANQLSIRLGMRGHAVYHAQDAAMDVAAVHANSMKLQLAQLRVASDGDFAHDVFGIRRWLNRDTGDLGCFNPRFRA